MLNIFCAKKFGRLRREDFGFCKYEVGGVFIEKWLSKFLIFKNYKLQAMLEELAGRISLLSLQATKFAEVKYCENRI